MKQLLTLLLIPCFCFSQNKDTVQIVGKLKDSTVDVLRFNRVTFSATTGIGDLPDSIRRLLTSSWTAPANRENLLTITPKQDTVKVLMLVCDTSDSPGLMVVDSKTRAVTRMRGYDLWWQFGYQIIIPDPWYYRIEDWKNGVYLDANKKRLSKSIIVWMTKEIK